VGLCDDDLAPRDGDILIPKTRLSGFFETNLDSILRGLGINTLIFIGIATNVCVEASLRDALYRDYKCLLIEDATNAAGPAYVKDASLYNVEMILGWVTSTTRLCDAFGGASLPATTASS
jgi:ureidoacrylate peracid hydrolase